MASKRPLVLWTCAALLGVAAGINLAVWKHNGYGITDTAARQRGFENGADEEVIAEMLDNSRIKHISSKQMVVLTKYATGPRNTPNYVAGVLMDIADDDEAAKVIPLVRLMRARQPQNVLLNKMPERWA